MGCGGSHAPILERHGGTAWGILRRAHLRSGFGSVRVKARIGKTHWDTSVFPDKASKSYLLPVKASVRKAEKLAAGKTVMIELDIA